MRSHAASSASLVAVSAVSAAALAFALQSHGIVAGRYVQDMVAMFDSAYRIDRGELPHRDFSLPFGPLMWSEAPQLAEFVSRAANVFPGAQNLSEPAEGIAWARCVDETARLAAAKGVIVPTSRVTTLGWVEPFARLLEATPMPHGRVWLAPNRTIVPLKVERARAYLAPADYVFVQVLPSFPMIKDMIEEWFMPAMRAEFRLVVQTRCYQLWARAAGRATSASLP